MDAELHGADLLDAGLPCSSPRLRTFGRSGLSIYRNICPFFPQLFKNFLHRESSRLVIVFVSSFFFFNLTYNRWTSSLPSCLWSLRIFPSLLGSRLTSFLSRCKFSTLITMRRRAIALWDSLTLCPWHVRVNLDVKAHY